MKTKLARLIAASLLALLAAMNARAESIAMSWYALALSHMGDLRTALSLEQLVLGAEAISRAKELGGGSERDCELIDAVAQFFHRHDERSHDERLVHYERALSRSRRQHPDDEVIARAHDSASRVALGRARERAEAAYARRLAGKP